jgi:hypothetical protein
MDTKTKEKIEHILRTAQPLDKKAMKMIRAIVRENQAINRTV